MAIVSWKHKGLRKFFETGDTSGIQVNHVKKLRLLLFQLDHISNAKEMDTPGNNLHRLFGKLHVYYAVKVSANWRLVFAVDDTDVTLVDYLDYH